MFRIVVLLAILAWVLGLIKDYSIFIELYAYLYFIPIAILAWAIVRSQFFKLVFQRSTVTKKLSGAMVKFGGAYFLGNILNVVAKTNDTIIIASQSTGGLADAAIIYHCHLSHYSHGCTTTQFGICRTSTNCPSLERQGPCQARQALQENSLEFAGDLPQGFSGWLS